MSLPFKSFFHQLTANGQIGDPGLYARYLVVSSMRGQLREIDIFPQKLNTEVLSVKGAIMKIEDVHTRLAKHTKGFVFPKMASPCRLKDG